MNNTYWDGSSKACFVGGLSFTLFANLHSSDVAKTVVLAATGAIVSFSISVILKRALYKWRK